MIPTEFTLRIVIDASSLQPVIAALLSAMLAQPATAALPPTAPPPAVEAPAEPMPQAPVTRPRKAKVRDVAEAAPAAPAGPDAPMPILPGLLPDAAPAATPVPPAAPAATPVPPAAPAATPVPPAAPAAPATPREVTDADRTKLRAACLIFAQRKGIGTMKAVLTDTLGDRHTFIPSTASAADFLKVEAAFRALDASLFS